MKLRASFLCDVLANAKRKRIKLSSVILIFGSMTGFYFIFVEHRLQNVDHHGGGGEKSHGPHRVQTDKRGFVIDDEELARDAEIKKMLQEQARKMAAEVVKVKEPEKVEKKEERKTCGFEKCHPTKKGRNIFLVLDNIYYVVCIGILNVHLVPHSHDDVGWRKTVDQYYEGIRVGMEDGCVKCIISTVVEELAKDPTRR